MKPTVCCVMLVDGRREMVARAARCFRDQDYEGKRFLLAFNTGPETQIDGAVVWNAQALKGQPIGKLRNGAQQIASRIIEPDVMLVLDSDDWYHRCRIREQVELLQSSGADVVGYNRVLYYDEPAREAWLYNQPTPHYVTGNSMCYWRKVAEAKPFPDLAHGSDTVWIQGLKVLAHTDDNPGEPRMIGSIHGGNSTARIVRDAREWTRVSEWDSYCRERMR